LQALWEVRQDSEILRRLKEFVAQLSHAHSDAARTERILHASQRLINRQHKELRVIDTTDGATRPPRRHGGRRSRRRR
jgi:hypothetical protein